MGFYFFIPEVMDRVKLQDSTPQNGLKIIHNDHTYITEDYTSLCLNIICNRSSLVGVALTRYMPPSPFL
jgi:hypothetical protein